MSLRLLRVLLLLVWAGALVAPAPAAPGAATASPSTPPSPWPGTTTGAPRSALHGRDLLQLASALDTVAATSDIDPDRRQAISGLERGVVAALAALETALSDVVGLNGTTAAASATAAKAQGPTVATKEALHQKMKTAQLAAMQAQLDYQSYVDAGGGGGGGGGGGAAVSPTTSSGGAGPGGAAGDAPHEASVATNRTVGNGTEEADAPTKKNKNVVMDEVKQAADKLEAQRVEHTFDEVQKRDRGVTIETVLRVEGDDIYAANDKKEDKQPPPLLGLDVEQQGLAEDDMLAQKLTGEDHDQPRQRYVYAEDEDDDDEDGAAAAAAAAAAAGAAAEPLKPTVPPSSQPAAPDRKRESGGVSFLVDPDNNVYVLARPKDTTVPYEDSRLLYDLVRVVVSSFVCGHAATVVGLPSIFGYILAGIWLGPSGLNLIKSFVQVETIAQLGIFLMLFVLGLEFSVDKLRRVWNVAVYGSGLLMAVITLLGALVAVLLGGSPVEGLAVGFCASLSSTAVVVTSLTSHELADREGHASVGVLVLQDMYLGILLAILPIMQHTESWHQIVWTVGNLLLATAVYLFMAYLINRVFMSLFLRWVVVRVSSPAAVALLGMLSHCFIMMALAEALGLSLELGCFVAGLQASSRNGYIERGIPLLVPVRDLFAALFFASIGLHIYPLFLYQQLPLLLVLTASIVAAKVVLGFIAFRFVFGYSGYIIALALSQVSEFAFVIAARSKGLGLISREVYYLVLGTTALSLLTTPFLLKVFRRRWRDDDDDDGGGGGGGSISRLPHSHPI